MAIFGAGSNWNNEEIKQQFFDQEQFIIGWDYKDAKDLYQMVSNLKVGDIIYLKSNQPGSRTIRVKGVGIIQNSFIDSLMQDHLSSEEIRGNVSFYLRVKWFYKDEVLIQIPDNEGKLTNVRAATFYEEFLPYVQQEILKILLDNLKNT